MKPASSSYSQRGVALFVALMILVIISILGIAAMRSSITNARIATGIQGGAMTFQAAQSAINKAIEDITYKDGVASTLLSSMVLKRNQGEQPTYHRCLVNGKSTEVDSSCSSSQFFDTRKLLQSSYDAYLEKNQSVALGYSTLAFNTIVVTGSGSMVSLTMTDAYVQELAMMGPKISDVESDDWN